MHVHVIKIIDNSNPLSLPWGHEIYSLSLSVLCLAVENRILQKLTISYYMTCAGYALTQDSLAPGS